MEELYRIESHPLCPTASVVQGERYRISVLTPRLFRLEYSEDGVFEGPAHPVRSQPGFATPAFQVFETEDTLKIVTEGVQLLYDKQKFSPSGLSVTVKAKGGSHNGVWHYGDEVEDLAAPPGRWIPPMAPSLWSTACCPAGAVLGCWMTASPC